MIRVSFILGFILLAATSQSQSQSNPAFQIWTDFNPRVRLTEQFKIVGDIGYRIEPESSAQSFLIRGAARYSPNQILSFDLGLAEFITWNTSFFNSSEFRTFQFLFVNWPNIGKFRFQHRLGIEQRIFRFSDLRANQFVHRARYRLGVKSPEFSLFGSTIPFYIKANAELLRDLNDEDISVLIDGDRFMIGFGSLLSEKLRSELQFQVMALHDPAIKKFIRNIDLIRIRAYYQFR
jgi:hypothetical protein